MKEKGYPVVDADQLARDVIQPGTPGFKKVVQDFGQDVLSVSGEIDRSVLAKKIFADAGLRERLESIIHPEIRKKVEDLKSHYLAKDTQIVFYDVPLLFEKNMQSQFDLKVLVYAPQELQIQRMRSRNHYSEDEIKLRLASQTSIESKRKLADLVIDNSSNIDALKIAVDQFLESIKKI